MDETATAIQVHFRGKREPVTLYNPDGDTWEDSLYGTMLKAETMWGYNAVGQIIAFRTDAVAFISVTR